MDGWMAQAESRPGTSVDGVIYGVPSAHFAVVGKIDRVSN